MREGVKVCLVLLCAVLTVYSFFRPNLLLILADFVLALYLYYKGYLSGSPRKQEETHGDAALSDREEPCAEQKEE